MSMTGNTWKNECNQVRMKANVKHKVNNAICKALKPTYFDTIQLATCINILEEHGYTIIQEDYTPWDGLICGATGHENFTIAEKDDNLYHYNVVKNASLSLSWHKMASGRYEVIAYVA